MMCIGNDVALLDKQNYLQGSLGRLDSSTDEADISICPDATVTVSRIPFNLWMAGREVGGQYQNQISQINASLW